MRHVRVEYKGMKQAVPKYVHQYVHRGRQLPLVVERGEDGWYVAECPLFEGCYTQGRTIDEVLRNIREVIQLILEERGAQRSLRSYHPSELSLHTITL